MMDWFCDNCMDDPRNCEEKSCQEGVARIIADMRAAGEFVVHPAITKQEPLF